MQKKLPAREASRQFVDRVRIQVNEIYQIDKKSEDAQNSRYSHQDWRAATESISSRLDQIFKEPKHLLFFRGEIYEISFNVEGKLFRNTQMDLIFDIPSEEDLRNGNKIKVLKYPLVLKDTVFEINASK